jgi:hypothetical protein
MEKIEIIEITPENIDNHPPRCFLNPSHEGYQMKKEWLHNRFSEGMTIKLLYLHNKCIGFIEYVPGEYAWRPVKAKDYLFIHCIWISPNKHKEKGNGSLLVKDCVKHAERQGKLGVAVITSEGPFMAGKELFLKNGFIPISHAKPSYELLVKQLKKGPLPGLNKTDRDLSTYQGFHIIYANQCPWVARSIRELGSIAREKGLALHFTELRNAEEAQQAPNVYGVFTLIYNGTILADHYISTTRFKNILKQIK